MSSTEEKFCVDCKHFIARGKFCGSPENGTDPVDGKVKVIHAYAVRGNYSRKGCGTSGDLFVPREPARSLFDKMFGFLK